MKSKNKFLYNSYGFSLIEVIITIIVSAVAFSMIFQFLGSSVMKSSEPIHRLSCALELKQIAERITEHYEQDTTDLNKLKDSLADSPDRYGSNYKVACDFIKFDDQNDVEISGSDGSDPEDILKVTIMHNDNREKITMLFRLIEEL
jgi:prepilin-type N-terminal cleavage/methylation domain-containing protein